MKNIQYLGQNNTEVAKHIVKGCVKACTEFVEGDELIVATIPIGAMILGAYASVFNPTEDKVPFTVDIGIGAIGHNIASFEYADGTDASVMELDPVVTVASENVVITLDGEMPKGSSICIFVEYLNMTTHTADNVEEEPNLCECPTDCNVYGN